MPSLGNIIMGLIGVSAGIYLIKEAYYLNHHIFFLSWAENKWGPGSGTLAYRYIGVATIIFSIFVLTGYINLFQGGLSNPPGQTQNTGQNIPAPSRNVQIAP